MITVFNPYTNSFFCNRDFTAEEIAELDAQTLHKERMNNCAILALVDTLRTQANFLCKPPDGTTPPRFPSLSTFGNPTSPTGRPKSTPEYDQSIFNNREKALDGLRKCISYCFIKPIASIVSNAKHQETKSALQNVLNRQRLSESADATSTILYTLDDPENPKTAQDVAPAEVSRKEKRKLEKLDPAKSVASQVEAKLMKQIAILQDALGEQQRSNAKWEAKMNTLVKTLEAKKLPGAQAPSAKKKKKGAPTPPSQQQRTPSPHQDASSTARQQRNSTTHQGASSTARQQRNQTTHQARPQQQQSRRNRAAVRTQQRVQGRDPGQTRADWIPPRGNPPAQPRVHVLESDTGTEGWGRRSEPSTNVVRTSLNPTATRNSTELP
jgi:hypothetical protein